MKSNLIGREIKGFEFWDGMHSNLSWNRAMASYIGLPGVIRNYLASTDSYTVVFENRGIWSYPATLIEKYLVPETAMEAQTKNSQLETKQMNYFKTKEILDREITLVVSVSAEDNYILSGYSVRNPDDKSDRELAKKIALGRANKKNLTPDMLISTTMKQKYILAAIAEKLLSDIERGVIEIKGIKKSPVSEPSKSEIKSWI